MLKQRKNMLVGKRCGLQAPERRDHPVPSEDWGEIQVRTKEMLPWVLVTMHTEPAGTLCSVLKWLINNDQWWIKGLNQERRCHCCIQALSWRISLFPFPPLPKAHICGRGITALLACQSVAHDCSPLVTHFNSRSGSFQWCPARPMHLSIKGYKAYRLA